MNLFSKILSSGFPKLEITHTHRRPPCECENIKPTQMCDRWCIKKKIEAMPIKAGYFFPIFDRNNNIN